MFYTTRTTSVIIRIHRFKVSFHIRHVEMNSVAVQVKLRMDTTQLYSLHIYYILSAWRRSLYPGKDLVALINRVASFHRGGRITLNPQAGQNV